MSNTDAIRNQAANTARLGQPAPVYKPSMPSTLKEAGKAAYDQTKSQKK